MAEGVHIPRSGEGGAAGAPLICRQNSETRGRKHLLMAMRLFLLSAASVLTLGMSSISAQEAEVIALGDGSTITVEDYLLETSETGPTTIVVKARPNFDPEPFGAVPSDDFARKMQPLCSGLVQFSRAAIEEENAKAIRIRWDFDPTYDTGAPGAVTITRFHEFLFALDENLMCIPQPLGVGLDNLEPSLPSGLPVVLRYIEPGPRARQLTLTYEVDADLADISTEKLENAAIELCILHADIVLDEQNKYYSQRQTELVALAFAQADGRGQELERRMLFGVEGNRCDTGLSQQLADVIRGMAGSEPAAGAIEAQQ